MPCPDSNGELADFAQDLLQGADAIAQFLWGNPALRRRVYHLVATSNLPTFKLGSMICARKSVLLLWVQQQEDRHARRGAPKRGGAALETARD
jgi:hypothetical protein